MKLTFKDLKQQKFVIEAEPSELISDVKAKIAEEKGWDAAAQKLIYSGKILQDANTVESYKIEEKGFIVCMVSKPKAPPAAAKPPATPAPAVASTPAAPAAPAPVPAGSTSTIPSTPTPAGAAGAGGAAAPPASSTGGGQAQGRGTGLAMGAERAAQVAEMEAMGFERSQIDAAMRAAFYNGERAIEYLLNGIPENLQQEQRQPNAAAGQGAAPAAAAAAAATTSPPAAGTTGGAATADAEEAVNLFEAAAAAGQGGGRGSGGRGSGGGSSGAAGLAAASLLSGAEGSPSASAGAGGLGNLDFLRQNPQFQQLRQLVQQQPQMLEPILQQVGAGNPQLAQLIGQHPEQFLQLLTEDHADDDAPLPPGAQEISVTQEEQEAIERLVSLGFSRPAAIQAYFACDKNEELAANFLFDQPDAED